MDIGAVFSLMIALLGLLGFIKDESLRRSKEMAVRKINVALTSLVYNVCRFIQIRRYHCDWLAREV